MSASHRNNWANIPYKMLLEMYTKQQEWDKILELASHHIDQLSADINEQTSLDLEPMCHVSRYIGVPGINVLKC